MENEICDKCYPIYSLGGVVGFTLVSYVSYVGFKYINSALDSNSNSNSNSNSKLKPTSDEISPISSIRKKVVGVVLNTYCQFRWTKDQLSKQLIIPVKPMPKFLISQLWKMEGGLLISVIPKIEPEQAEKFEIISLETLGLGISGCHFNYLIEYYWRSINGEKIKFLMPCPGRRLLSGLDTQADWLFDETNPDEFIEFKFNLNSESELENYAEMLVQYSGPLQNFYQGSDFEVTGRKIFSTLNRKRMLSYTESIEAIDPILEEKIVFTL